MQILAAHSRQILACTPEWQITSSTHAVQEQLIDAEFERREGKRVACQVCVKSVMSKDIRRE